MAEVRECLLMKLTADQYYYTAKNYELQQVVENRIEQCCAAHIVQCCQQYCSALLHLIAGYIQAQQLVQNCWQQLTIWAAQHCSILFSTTRNFFACMYTFVCLKSQRCSNHSHIRQNSSVFVSLLCFQLITQASRQKTYEQAVQIYLCQW